MRTKVQYHFSSSEQGYESSIEDDSGHHHKALERTPCGETAYSRFFGMHKEAKFVVKQPKPFHWRGDKDELANTGLVAKYKERYEEELKKWNLIHPNHEAILITDQGLRLILPALPGKTLTSFLYQFPHYITEKNDQLLFCKIILAVLNEVKRVHELGFYHGDFKSDNVLIEERDGVFRAFLIDCDGIARRSSLGGTCPPEWLLIEQLLDYIGGLKDDKAEGYLDYIDLRSIEANIKENKAVLKELDKAKNELSHKKPTIMVVNDTASADQDYFVYGCLDNGQWGFTPLDKQVMKSAKIASFSGKLNQELAPAIVDHITQQKGHIHCRLDLCINSLQAKLNNLELALRFSQLICL